jgi:hypothetical protein
MESCDQKGPNVLLGMPNDPPQVAGTTCPSKWGSSPSTSSKGPKYQPSMCNHHPRRDSCGPRCVMKIEDKVHNPNTTYKVSHVNTKTIRYISWNILFKLHTSLQKYIIFQVKVWEDHYYPLLSVKIPRPRGMSKGTH